MHSEFTVVVLASGNRGKLRELADLLQPLGLELRPQSAWDVPEVAEDGMSFIENALIKARHASEHTGLPAIADDSGLVVPALDGAPGIFSARYAGAGASDSENNRKLLAAMERLDGADRRAYFHCTMVFLRNAADPVPLVSSSSWWGRIARSASGSGGFGYDPLFWLEERACTSAELPATEKNRTSHRGQAAAALVECLREERRGGGC